MLKLLLIAPACDGQDVGEAWVGYQWVRCLAARHDLTVLTYYKHGRTPLSHQIPSVRTIEWAEPPGIGRAERLNSLMKPGYVPFYFRARRWIRDALARGERFDLAHQLIPVALRYPSPVARLGIPFVVGPVGGGLPSPRDFRREEGTSAWYVGLRRFDQMRLRRDPLLRLTYRKADCVIGIAPYVSGLLEGIPVRRFEVVSETGLLELPARVDRAACRDEVRMLFVGRLIRTKGARDAIRALGLIRDLPVSLDIAGDGFDRRACESLASELGVAGRVRFHGWVTREQVERLYRSADLFVFPSYREPGGNVIFEAMSHGLPMVVSDVGGPGNAVDETCGLRIHPVSPAQYARDLAAALRCLATDPQLRRSLGDGARRRVSQIGLWDSKVRLVESIYNEVLADDRITRQLQQ